MHVNTINRIIALTDVIEREIKELKERDDVVFECEAGVVELSTALLALGNFKDLVKGCRHG